MSGSGLRLRFPAELKPVTAAGASINDQEMDSPSRRISRVRAKPKKYVDYSESSPSKRSTKEYKSSDEAMDEELNQQSTTQEQETDVVSRRTSRVRTRPKKYVDYLESSPSKRRSVKEYASTDEEMTEELNECHIKPTALFGNEDVEGQEMFQFKSRHTKLDLQNKVKSVISSSPTVTDSPKTPRKIVPSMAMRNCISKVSEATPRHVKNIIKKRIIQEVESESEESNFSADSSSDFAPEGSEPESESSQSSEEADDASNSEEESSKPVEKVQISKNKSKTRPKDSEYFVTPDNYFMMHSSKKIATSDHTLARLKNLNLDNESQNIQLSNEHQTKIIELNNNYSSLFNKWLYVLSENFNIILYGIGSKRSILHQFQKEKLKDFPCIVVNGFFPSLTIKSILESIVVDLLENTHIPSNIGDIVNLIDSQLNEKDVDLFLIVHNIDGAMLRNAKAQATLASISQIKKVHTIATIDHINAPLLWDHSKLSKFKFTWWDVTTLMPYIEETSFESSLMSARSGALQLSSLKSVYQSLTSNAKGIFNIIIEYQLENQKQHYAGLLFKDLYSKSREQFLVSSDLALRAQLTEFLDHKLVRMKRTYDGSENLIIPIENILLQQFLEQQKSL